MCNPHHCLVPEYSPPPNRPLLKSCHSPCSAPGSTKPPSLCSGHFLSMESHTLCVLLGLASLPEHHGFKSIHKEACIRASLLFMAESESTVGMDPVPCIHLGTFGWFPFGGCGDHRCCEHDIHMCTHVLWTCVFLSLVCFHLGDPWLGPLVCIWWIFGVTAGLCIAASF